MTGAATVPADVMDCTGIFLFGLISIYYFVFFNKLGLERCSKTNLVGNRQINIYLSEKNTGWI